jgi:hypothetical protein
MIYFDVLTARRNTKYFKNYLQVRNRNGVENMQEPHDEEDSRAKYWTWIDANEDKILSAWHESEKCWEYAVSNCSQDGVYADDIDAVIDWIESHVKLKHVPDDFVESMYEQSFEVDEDYLYEQSVNK